MNPKFPPKIQKNFNHALIEHWENGTMLYKVINELPSFLGILFFITRYVIVILSIKSPKKIFGQILLSGIVIVRRRFK